jgi:hypothetical protein
MATKQPKLMRDHIEKLSQEVATSDLANICRIAAGLAGRYVVIDGVPEPSLVAAQAIATYRFIIEQLTEPL